MTDRELLVAGLAAVPGLLRELTLDVLGADGSKPPAVGEWGVIDVVRHLVEGDREKFLPRLRRMLAEDRPVFSKTALDPGDASDLPTLVAAFGSAREQVAKTLAGNGRDGLEPYGCHPEPRRAVRRGLRAEHDQARYRAPPAAAADPDGTRAPPQALRGARWR